MSNWLVGLSLLLSSSAAFAQAPWPGQPGNPVGWQSFGCPGGRLTPYTGGDITVGGTADAPLTLTCMDFLDSLTIAAPHVRIQGSRFQATGNSGLQVVLLGGFGVTDVTLYRNSFTPYVALAPTPKCGNVWPTCGAGMQYAPEDMASNPHPRLVDILIDNAVGYESAISDSSEGTMVADHNDMWGWSNAICFDSTTGLKTVTDNWIHDSRHPGYQPFDDHGDGVGYLNGGVGPSNVIVKHNTIVAQANTNSIAFQYSTVPYKNISVIGNYMAGFDWMFNLGDATQPGSTGLIVTGNVFSSVIPWAFSPIFGDLTTVYRAPGNLWQGNRFAVWPGTAPTVNQTVQWQPSWDGWFIVPNGNAPYQPADFN